jgi:hypothetical protein
MKITVTKIKKKMAENYGWSELSMKTYDTIITQVVKDTLNIINDDLIKRKNISIKK